MILKDRAKSNLHLIFYSFRSKLKPVWFFKYILHTIIKDKEHTTEKVKFHVRNRTIDLCTMHMVVFFLLQHGLYKHNKVTVDAIVYYGPLYF